MRILGISLTVVLLALTPSSAFHQNAQARATDVEQAKHSLAVNVLRAINTAEFDYRMKQGSFAAWDTLVSSDEFTKGTKWAAQNDPQFADAHFSKGSEILPGWTLRLNLTQDAKGYDVMLEDTTDQKCGYAVVTDERGLIRQSKAIDCEI
jgi:riboflavin synthase alpha subunit